MDNFIIRNWEVVVSNSNPYMAPELINPRLKGNVFGHPKFPDGSSVITSPIVGAAGRVVDTYSGSKYRLGNIEPGYRKHLRKIRPDWNWREPITVRP